MPLPEELPKPHAAVTRSDKDEALKIWDISLTDFGILISLLLCCMVVVAMLADGLATLVLQPEEGDSTLLITLWKGLGMQLGFLFAYLAFRLVFLQKPAVDRPKGSKINSLLIGLKWMAFTYPAMWVVALIWQAILTPLGFEQNTQEPVKMIQNGGTPFEMLLMYTMVVLVAPICEEFTFRASIFRYLHLRTPLYFSLVVSGALFALIHFNLYSFAPLLVIGIGLALAYRESGSILSSIVFHSAFNTIQLLMILYVLEPQ